MAGPLKERTSLRIISSGLVAFGAWQLYQGVAHSDNLALRTGIVLVAFGVLGLLLSFMPRRRR